MLSRSADHGSNQPRSAKLNISHIRSTIFLVTRSESKNYQIMAMLEFKSRHLKISYTCEIYSQTLLFFGSEIDFFGENISEKNSTDFASFFWFNQFLFSHPTVSDGFRRKVFALAFAYLCRMSPHPCFFEMSLSRFENWNGPGPFVVIFSCENFFHGSDRTTCIQKCKSGTLKAQKWIICFGAKQILHHICAMKAKRNRHIYIYIYRCSFLVLGTISHVFLYPERFLMLCISTVYIYI